MVGQTIGRYRIVERIDAGASRGAYRAIDEVIGRDVAITVLDADLNDSGVLERIRREMVAIDRLHHPNIATVFDLFQHEGEGFLVGELAPGETLEALVARKGPLAIQEAGDYCTQVLGALAQAHTLGVVHRDLSPANVKVLDSGSVKIMGFGVAGVGIDHLTSPDIRLDAIACMAPEQLSGKSVDARADLYAVGVLFFYLLTAKLPFSGSTPGEVAAAKISGQPASIESLRTDLPMWVSEVMTTALANDPDRRFQSAELFRDFLTRSLSGDTAAGMAASPATPRPSIRFSVPDVPVTSVPQPPSAGSVEKAGGAGIRALDENVQFTVFRPRVLPPAEWRTMLVFAHLAERRADDSEDSPDPTAEVSRQAAAVLGDVSQYRQLTEDSSRPVPREGDLLFVPLADGIQFNPPSRAFSWTESVHKEEFRLRASAAMAGRTVSGRVTVYLGAIVIAEIGLTLKVGSSPSDGAEPAATSARPYRNIFASYSHRDRAIVDEFSEYARAIGDRYLRDVIDLRTGERWSPGLEGLIRQADVFQLFWSWNALASEDVRQEWQYALSLGRRSFVRPVYWDDPLPEEKGLPPEALRELHFERIQPRSVAVTAPPKRPSTAPHPGQSPEESNPTTAVERTGQWAPTDSAPQGPLPAAPTTGAGHRYLVYAGAAAAAIVVIGIGFQTLNSGSREGVSRTAAVERPQDSAAAAPSTRPQQNTDQLLTFADVALYVGGGRTLSSEDVVLSFSDGQISVSGRAGGKERLTMSYRELLAATYTRAPAPAWDPSLPSPTGKINGIMNQRVSRHWLTLQTKDAFLILSLDDSSWLPILETIDDRTGVTVDRRIPNQTR